MKTSLAATLLLTIATHLTNAQVTIVYSGIKNYAIPLNFDGIYVDIDNGNIGTADTPGIDINPFFGGLGIANTAAFQPARAGTDNMSPYINLAFGTTVNSSLNFATGEGGTDRNHMTAHGGTYTASVDGYIGFRFTPNAGGDQRYGWMRVTLTPNTNGAMIKDWAYESTGAPIQVGATAIPESSTTMLFAATLGGMLLRRRRQS